MTGRPPMPIGAYGKISTPKEISAGVWWVMCRHRDPDGVTRRVTATGASKSAATNKLKAALADRQHTAGSTLGGGSRLVVAAELWLAQRTAETEAGDLARRTLEAYESSLRLHVLPALGQVRLREATTVRCEAWLVELRKRKGPSTCRRARSVLSGILGYAARMGAIPGNPVGDLSPIPGKRTRQPRSMTREERDGWLAWMDTHVAVDPKVKRRPELAHPTDEVIAGRALGDITRLMLATGCRIGEVMAVSWDEVDLDAGTVAICWHLVRVKGDGLHRVPGAKSDAGDRVLRLPRWALDMLLRRRVDGRSGYPVFPDSLGGWRDPNLIMRWFRWSRDQAGYGWVTSHVFRQTVITVLDEAGLPTREVADQAGHAQISQTQQYMGRKVASSRAAEALESLL